LHVIGRGNPRYCSYAPDAELELAVEGVAGAIFFNHGQCCCAGSRIFAGPRMRDELVVPDPNNLAGPI
jgi:phenylacetaldehyde dehydrogenase